MILVDRAVWKWRGELWAHMVSDTSFEELHTFAQGMGMPRHIFQGDHYDVHSELRELAIRRGAVAVDARELVRRISAAGLRRR